MDKSKHRRNSLVKLCRAQQSMKSRLGKQKLRATMPRHLVESLSVTFLLTSHRRRVIFFLRGTQSKTRSRPWRLYCEASTDGLCAMPEQVSQTARSAPSFSLSRAKVDNKWSRLEFEAGCCVVYSRISADCVATLLTQNHIYKPTVVQLAVVRAFYNLSKLDGTALAASTCCNVFQRTCAPSTTAVETSLVTPTSSCATPLKQAPPLSSNRQRPHGPHRLTDIHDVLIYFIKECGLATTTSPIPGVGLCGPSLRILSQE